MNRTDEQQAVVDKKDYIDIMAFLRAFLRSTRRYLPFALALIIFMTVCVTGGMAVLSKKIVKKTYVAKEAFAIGVLLSDSIEYNYVLNGLGWNKGATLSAVTNALSGLMGSEYMNQRIREEMGLEPDDEMNGTISTEVTYATNLIRISVTSDSKEDAEAIREAIFACFREAFFPVMGYVELDVINTETEEIPSSLGFLASPVVWIALGIFLGAFMYLGLIFCYALLWSNLETPEDVSDIMQTPCLAQLPVKKKKKSDSDYKKAFVGMRRRILEEIEKRKIKVLLLEGINNKKVQSDIALELQSELRGQGKNAALTVFDDNEETLTAENVQKTLDEHLSEADIVLIDGPLYGRSAAPLILADCADAVIYMIEQGNAPPQKVKDMLQSLQYARAESIGYVIDSCTYIQ